MDLLTRQAHPGPGVRPYRTAAEKLRDGERYLHDEQIPWPVVVDELEGRVHQVYGGLADPTYLIDADGRVAFYNMWTHVPTLHRAVEALLAQGGRGVVLGGIDHRPHLLAAIADGWKGLRRGLPQSFTDIETAMPGMGSGPWLGDKLRPMLRPIALRSRPLPATAKVALGVAALGAVALVAGRRRGS